MMSVINMTYLGNLFPIINFVFLVLGCVGIAYIFLIIRKNQIRIEKTERILKQQERSASTIKPKEPVNALYENLIGIPEVDEYELTDEYSERVTAYLEQLLTGKLIQVKKHIFIERQSKRGFFKWDDRFPEGKHTIGMPRVVAYLRQKAFDDFYNED